MKNTIDFADEYVKKISKFSTSIINDALQSLMINGQCLDLQMMNMKSNGHFCARVFTVQFLPCGTPDARTPNGDIDDYLDSVSYAIAIDNRGHLNDSVWNSQLSVKALEKNIAATVIDGACHQEDASDSIYPLYAKGTQVRSGKNRVRVEAFNLPVVIGGVRVECDDIMIGDTHSVVVVPRDYIGLVLGYLNK